MHQVKLEPRAKKGLDRLPKYGGDMIALSIARLALDPRPSGCVKVGAGDLYRIRAGRYRVLYEVRDRELVVLVVRVARRDEHTYRDV